MGSPFTPLYFSTLELSNLCIHYKSHNVIICALNNQMFYSFTRKMVLMKLFAGQQWRHRPREQTYGYSGGGRRGRDVWERNMETYITVCKRDSQREFAVWLRELKAVLCNSLEEWNGEGSGREVQEGGNLWLMLMYGRIQHNSVKQSSFS